MSIQVSFKRVAKAGFVGFIRNGFISLAATMVMTLSLFTAGIMMMSHNALSTVLESVTNKVDINVYFITQAEESEIGSLKIAIEGLPEVASVAYRSREDSLNKFKERHSSDKLILSALDELGENPLGASFSIRAKEIGQYQSIAKFLEDQTPTEIGARSIIEKVNYNDNKTIIDRIAKIMYVSKIISLSVVIFFAIISFLIIFNTIRLVIYTVRDEIQVMRLVGASDTFVQGPFLISGALYGLTGGLVAIALMYPFSLYFADSSKLFFGNFDTLSYFVQNLPFLLFTLVGSGVFLGIFSSYLSVRRYAGR